MFSWIEFFMKNTHKNPSPDILHHSRLIRFHQLRQPKSVIRFVMSSSQLLLKILLPVSIMSRISVNRMN